MSERQELEPEGLSRFTEEARRVLVFSQEEASDFNHNYIGSEHILLGLAREESASEVLESLGATPRKIRSAIEFMIGRGESQPTGEIGLTPRAKKIIDYAVEEARLDREKQVTPIHLLAGTIREGEGIAFGVLESLGVTRNKITRVVRALRERPAPMPEIVNKLKATLEDPNIDKTTKDRITTVVNEIINLAQKQK